MKQEIPIGYCQCGCGQRTKINTETCSKRGIAAGQPYRYVRGHNARKEPLPDSLLSDHLCECGCGNYTNLCARQDKSRGLARGQAQRFCLGHHKAAVTTPQGFWKRVDVRAPDECWPWLRYVNDSGYGVTRTSENKAVRASHIAYELTNGTIPKGMFVLHSCDNPACCNPAHLSLGTHTDNMRDMDRKGRRVNSPHYGESHGMSKLTEAQVIEIRRLATSGISYEEIGRRFKISDVHAGRIAMRRCWAHVP